MSSVLLLLAWIFSGEEATLEFDAPAWEAAIESVFAQHGAHTDMSIFIDVYPLPERRRGRKQFAKRVFSSLFVMHT